MAEIVSPDCDPRIVFVYLLLTNVIDAIDGPLARRFEVKTRAPAFDGRTIDDLLDYLTFAFIPLMLIWRMDWLPQGWGWTVTLAMGSSLLGFSHRHAKDEDGGFFRGFPSYWNIFAFYAGILFVWGGGWAVAFLMWTLSVMTLSPLRFIYPNLAPRRLRRILLGGAAGWVAVMLLMLYPYPHPPGWLTLVSLVYPLFYVAASWQLASSHERTT
ncbi:phosphatidylcholine/phosphatidylserine synthase [Stieleria sp.]|uniref:CDP-alcohol phosphatidyltransferase family protein n=1 Tax=Stieleria sp. TaxID=2795976 RepID=UPI003566C8C2